MKHSFVTACESGREAVVVNILKWMDWRQTPTLLLHTDWEVVSGLALAITNKNTGVMQVIYRHIMSFNDPAFKESQLLRFLAVRDKHGTSTFDYTDTLARNIDVLNRYYKDLICTPIRNECFDVKFWDCFPDFVMHEKALEIKDVNKKGVKEGVDKIKDQNNEIKDVTKEEQKEKEEDTEKENEINNVTKEQENEEEPVNKTKDKVSFHTMFSTHPLTVIADTGCLPLIKHPYVQMYVDISWHSLARYVLYINLLLYLLFLASLCVFITSHKYIGR